MHFLNNLQPFTHKMNQWVNIKYFLSNQILDHLYNPDMESIILK